MPPRNKNRPLTSAEINQLPAGSIEALTKTVIFLRYPPQDSQTPRLGVSRADIAGLLDISTYWVNKVIDAEEETRTKSKPNMTVAQQLPPPKHHKQQYFAWRAAHLAGLKAAALKKETLFEQAQLSIGDRVAVLNAEFGTNHLTKGLLRRWKKDHQLIPRERERFHGRHPTQEDRQGAREGI